MNIFVQMWRSLFRTGVTDSPVHRVFRVVVNFILHLHPARVSKDGIKITYTFCLGGLSVLFFIMTALTGGLLMIYYTPDVDKAYANMLDLENVIPFGMFLRNLHRFAAHAMVISVSLHMLRVFLTASYKSPREFNWVIGTGLLLMTFLLSFTGYLLPWDQLSYWAVTVGTTMAENSPIVGAKGPFSVLGPEEDMRFILLGGTSIDQPTLIRFYFAHCIGLPGALVGLMAMHFWRVRKAGGISRPL
ncbi:MAG TPA: cytochrome b N-terminal domain-containing protein [Candidatus Hypogeohydataceae bacterium YC38]|nr:cytochrome b N-terminal domain-containing protein [Candidatus Brocadiales bacterium]